MGTSDANGPTTNKRNPTQTCLCPQTCSMTHGHTGLQTSPEVTNSSLWSAQHKEMTFQGGITIYVVWFSSLSLSSMMSLTVSFQVELKDTDPPKNSSHTCFGCSIPPNKSMENASANTVTRADRRRKSMKSIHFHPAKDIPKGLLGPKRTRKQGGDNRVLGESPFKGLWSKFETPSRLVHWPPQDPVGQGRRTSVLGQVTHSGHELLSSDSLCFQIPCKSTNSHYIYDAHQFFFSAYVMNYM